MDHQTWCECGHGTSLYKKPALISPSSLWNCKQLRSASCDLKLSRKYEHSLCNAVKYTFQNPLKKSLSRLERKDAESFFLRSLLPYFLSPYGSHLCGGGLSDINNRLWKNTRREGDACFLPEGQDLQRPCVLHGKTGRKCYRRERNRAGWKESLKEREWGNAKLYCVVCIGQCCLQTFLNFVETADQRGLLFLFWILISVTSGSLQLSWLILPVPPCSVTKMTFDLLSDQVSRMMTSKRKWGKGKE